MPLNELQSGNAIFSFPNLNKETYFGLPGLPLDLRGPDGARSLAGSRPSRSRARSRSTSCALNSPL